MVLYYGVLKFANDYVNIRHAYYCYRNGWNVYKY